MSDLFKNKILIKNLIILLAVIIGSAILVRFVIGGESLSEYAEKNGVPVHTEEQQK